jgi:hypothetical protein
VSFRLCSWLPGWSRGFSVGSNICHAR